MVNVENKHTIKVIFNANITITNPSIKNFYSSPTNVFLVVNIDDNNNKYSDNAVNNKIGKKQYDGSYTFTIDTKDKNYTGLIRVLYKNLKFGIFELNYLTVEFKESIISFNYKYFKSDISKY